MSGNSDDRAYTVTYPSNEQRDQWDDHAEQMDVSVSEYIQQMVEAGRKKFDPRDIQPDETVHELREQRNDLKDELEHTRSRIDDLEEQLYHGERATIRRFVEDNPGVTRSEITQRVIKKSPSRVNRHLTDLESEGELTVDGDEYYPTESAEANRKGQQ